MEGEGGGRGGDISLKAVGGLVGPLDTTRLYSLHSTHTQGKSACLNKKN